MENEVVLKNGLYGVRANGNVRFWRKSNNEWVDPQDMKRFNPPPDWKIESLAFGQSYWWCVRGDGDYRGQLGQWNGSNWENLGVYGGWWIKFLAFDNEDVMYCVGTNGNVGKWEKGEEGEGRWVDAAGDWGVKSIAFDKENKMWCVGGNGNIGKWVGDKWVDQGDTYGKKDWMVLKSLAFDKKGAPRQGDMWCIRDDEKWRGNVGKWNGSSSNWEDLRSYGKYKSLVFVSTLKELFKIDPASGGWKNLPLDRYTYISLTKGGRSIKTILGTSVRTEAKNVDIEERTKGSETAVSAEISVESEYMGSTVSAKLGLSHTESSQVTTAVQNELTKSFDQMSALEDEIEIPQAPEGHVYLVYALAYVKKRNRPMTIRIGDKTVPVETPIYYSKIDYDGPYETFSPRLQKKWKEYQDKYPDLLSTTEADNYVYDNDEKKDVIGESSVLGNYRYQPVQNDWHEGSIQSITNSGGKLRWVNKAGVSWTLVPDYANAVLKTEDDNPYQETGTRDFTLILEQGKVTGFNFGGVYKKIE